MMDIFARSIARAGGIEVAQDARIFETPTSRRSFLKRIVQAFERWNVRRSTYLTLQRMDDRLLKDIGLHRGALYSVAGEIGRQAAANENVLPIALSNLAVNDNDLSASAECV
jgi:uncharacterized protein YjiS (DUF1127 family)